MLNHDDKLDISGIYDRPVKLNELEQKRWNESEILTFPNSKKIKYVKYHPVDLKLTERIMDLGEPILMKNSPAMDWAALEKWKNKDYINEKLGVINVHTPKTPYVRLHSPDLTLHPLNRFPELNFTNLPWIEKEIYPKIMFENPEKLIYYMTNIYTIPDDMKSDIYPLNFAMVPWSPPLEINFWAGNRFVTTPNHFDMVHNFYVQVTGKKRWILFNPKDHEDFALFPNIHPSDRMSMLNFNHNETYSIFDQFLTDKFDVYETVLEPGDCLYIPPFWFHYVTVVSEEVSMSISVHTESYEAVVRERVLGKSERLLNKLISFSAPSIPQNINILRYYIGLILLNIVDDFNEDEYKKSPLLTDTNEADHILSSYCKRILSARWDHLHHDKIVIGLDELLERGTNKFPSHEEINSSVLDEYQKETIQSSIKDIASFFSEVQFPNRDILLFNHIEHFTSYALGALNTKPFLKYCSNMI